MKISSQLENNYFLSSRFGQLSQDLIETKSMQHRRLELSNADVIKFMKNYEYRVNTWPIIINKQIVADFHHFISTFPPIVFKAIQCFFEGDAKKFSRYLNVPEILLEFIRADEIEYRELFARHDLIFSNNTFKLLEVNSGFSLGGWQLDWIQRHMRSILDEYECYRDWPLSYRNVTESMLAAVSASITRKKSENAAGNLLFVCSGMDEERDVYGELEKNLQQAYEKVKSSKFTDASLLFCDVSLDGVEFDVDGDITFNGKVIDGVFLCLPSGVELAESEFIKLFSSFLNGKIIFPDSPSYTIFGNKQVLSLLHEQKVLNCLSEDERALVRRHVPWSSRCTEEQAVKNGQTYNLTDLIIENKNDFVLKKSHSHQGRDVLIGKFTDQNEWRQRFSELSADDDWLVQEFCQADPVLACDSDLGVMNYDMVWGVFAFDNQYSGAFVRGISADETNGIINSATGATEFLVLEETKRNKRMVI